jgi:glutamate/tyrosine decarboxylase-like PLP-dependent enzyme
MSRAHQFLALVGIGSENCVNVAIDYTARVSIASLRDQIEERFQKGQPIYAVVAIIGSTEEGAVDPLDQMIELRDEYQAKGMSFVVHADAAW